MTGQSPEDTRLSVHTNSQSLSVNQNSRVWKKKKTLSYFYKPGTRSERTKFP